MIQVDVRSNIDDFQAVLRALPERLQERAIMRGINRAIDAVATQSSREVRKVYNLKDRDVKAALAKHKASKVTLTGDVTFRGRRIPLILFEAHWRQGQPGGATAKIFVGGQRIAYRGAFIAAARYNNAAGGGSAGQQQVFVRTGKARYPIKVLRGISIPLAVKRKVVLDALKAVASDTFRKNFTQQLRFLTGADKG